MKKRKIPAMKAFLMVFMCGTLMTQPAMGAEETAGELMNEFDQAFESLKPPTPSSSINSDYKIGQTALGTFYTTKTLGLIYEQNQELVQKYDQMLEKYDELIQQNKEIIRLLGIMAGKKTENSP